MNNTKMLYFDRTDIYEGVSECDISTYCYFLNKSFKFQRNICDRCHNPLMMSMKPPYRCCYLKHEMFQSLLYY